MRGTELEWPNDRARITVYPDGPYLVRGAFRIIGENGREIVKARKTIALCRCGRSEIKPWCDGTHKLVRAGMDAARRTPLDPPQCSG